MFNSFSRIFLYIFNSHTHENVFFFLFCIFKTNHYYVPIHHLKTTCYTFAFCFYENKKEKGMKIKTKQKINK